MITLILSFKYISVYLLNKEIETMENLNNIICINIKSHTAEQLFAISEKYSFSFKQLLEIKNENILKIWINKNDIVAIEQTSVNVTYVSYNKPVYLPFFYLTDKYEGLSDNIISELKNIKPVSTPKLSKSESTIENYKLCVESGLDIKIESLDVRIEKINDSKKEEDRKLKLNELELNLISSIEVENYELASIIRDEINSLKLF